MTDTPREAAYTAFVKGSDLTTAEFGELNFGCDIKKGLTAAINAYLTAAAKHEETIERCCEAVHAEGDKPMFSNRSIVSAVIKAIAEGKPSR